MGRLVQKFGGTSVADPQKIKHAAQIAVEAASAGHEVALVVSAMGHTTDQLIALAGEVTGDPSPREMDMLLSTGEQVSISLMTMAIQSLGGQARSFTGAQAGIVTEDKHGTARIKEVAPQAVEASLNRGEIAVIAGFQGVSERSEITTLGRGGSDTTAVAYASALGADRCDIYTDVKGVFTADPRLLADARRLPLVSYEEMLELSLSGAQVMNARSVEMAMDTHVPIRVRSTFEPDDIGTLITHRLVTPEYPLAGIACDTNQVSLTITSTHGDPLEGISSLFTRLSELNIQTDMVMLLNREDEPSHELAFTVEKRSLSRVRSLIEAFNRELGSPRIDIDESIARISVVGRGLSGRPQVVAGIFETLYSAAIPVSMVASGDLRVSAIVPQDRARAAVKLIHDRFGLSKTPPEGL